MFRLSVDSVPRYVPGYPLTDLYDSNNVPRYVPGYHSDLDSVPGYVPGYPLTYLHIQTI